METPKTDAEEYAVYSEGNYGMGDEYAEYVVSSEFARSLERELSMVKKLVKSLADSPISLNEHLQNWAES